MLLEFCDADSLTNFVIYEEDGIVCQNSIILFLFTLSYFTTAQPQARFAAIICVQPALQRALTTAQDAAARKRGATEKSLFSLLNDLY